MNYSKQREIIYAALMNNMIHPTAEQVYDLLKADKTDIGIATVYRNLNQMAAAGKIKKIEGLGASVHYDHNTYEHHHFLCTKCDQVFDIETDVAPEIVENTQRATGFIVSHYEIAFQGICTKCKVNTLSS